MQVRALLASGVFVIASTLFAACAIIDTDDPRPVAECVVCRFNGDLGCVRVRIDETTPFADYKGQRYYFCCEDCRDAFIAGPEKYLRPAGEGR
ncbi:MAG: YHS domain-containing protein [Planctomycetes bacterium]|nr:YHS domain-containing protein [Planctomycetota bacterium]NUQ34905.1 YHS domain-containing protein [Planctomycetaceae bacterium]